MSAVPDADLVTVARELRQSVVRLARRLRTQHQEHDVTPLAVSVLARIYRHHSLTPRAVADGEHVAPQTLTRVLAGLQRRGLISRQGDPTDGRQSLLEITTAGIDLLRRDSARREKWLAGAISAALSPAEQRIVAIAAELLDRLADE